MSSCTRSTSGLEGARSIGSAPRERTPGGNTAQCCDASQSVARGRQIIERSAARRGAARHVRRDQLTSRCMPTASGREGCGIQEQESCTRCATSPATSGDVVVLPSCFVDPYHQAYFVPGASDCNHITTASLYLYI